MSNTEFKAGDHVKCVDNKYVEQWFNLGETYIISKAHMDNEHIEFSHTDFAMWHSDRFELIEKEEDMKENKTVNGIELAEGQKWTTKEFGEVTLFRNRDCTYGPYNWKCVASDREFSVTSDGKYWSDDGCPVLLEYLYNPKQPKQFNPQSGHNVVAPLQPGDKIICNNGEEFTCCTKEFLLSKEIIGARHFEIHAYRDDPNNEFINIAWMGWLSDGKASGDKGYNIREVIPKNTSHIGPFRICDSIVENGVVSDVVAPKGLYYDSNKDLLSKEDIRNAWDDLGWLDESLEDFMESLNKVTSSEYKEYLWLKDMFEGAE